MEKSVNFSETLFPYLINGRVNPAQHIFHGFDDPE